MSPLIALALLGFQTQGPTCLMFGSENLARGNGNWFTYLQISDRQLKIQTGDVLKYSVFLDPNNPSPKGGVDVEFGADTPLRDMGLNDQNGIRAHGDGLLTPAVGKWYTRTIPLNDAAGETTSAWTIDFEGDEAGRFVQFLNDIEVDHSDGSKTVIYDGGSPQMTQLETANGYTNKPVCYPVPVSEVVAGPGLETMIQKAMAEAERLRNVQQVLSDVEIVESFVKTNPAVEAHILTAEKVLKACERPDATDSEIAAAIKQAQTEMSYAHPEMAKYTAHLVGYAHIDFQWLWNWQEAEVASYDTFNQAVKFLNEFPDFKFSQSSSGLYKAIEENHPDLFQKVKQKVAEGRIELLGGRVCEADTNVIGPESHARQFLYGQRYFREKFGKSAQVGWEPDTFGHTIQMPQILKLAGIDYYFFCRAGKDKPLFWWQGLDGSKVLAFDDVAAGSWYNSDLQDSQFNQMSQFHDKTGVKDMLYSYGVGNHGGGPTREEINDAKRWQKTDYLPKVQFSTAIDFFKSLGQYNLTGLPQIDQELNTVFEGCYSSHCEVKQAMREAENLTSTAEAISAVASLNGLPYPKGELRKNWEDICMNQHHDTMGGSGVHQPYDKTMMMLHKVAADDQEVIGHALETLVQRVTPEKNGVTVLAFNPCGWKRSGWCETYLVDSGWSPDNPLDFDRVVAIDPDGNSHTVEVVDGISKRARFWAADVPAFGYRVFHITNGIPPKMQAPPINGDPNYTLENDNLLVSFDTNAGCISQILDKRTGKTITGSGLGRLEEDLEEPHDMSAWDIGKISKALPLQRLDYSTRYTGNFKEVTFNYKLADLGGHHSVSTVHQTFRLEKDADMVTCKIECEWNEIGGPKVQSPNMRLCFDSGLPSPTATYDVPFGALSRPIDGHEYPGQKWADIGNANYGVSVLNDSIYGMSATGSSLRLTLIRSSYDPDPDPNPGHHEWNYAIYPHAGTWRQAGTVRRSIEFNQPLVSATVPFDASGKNPLEWGLADFSDPNVVATALKGAEDGDGFVMRCYQSTGAPSTGSVQLGAAFDSARWVNLIEDPLGAAPLSGTKLSLTMKPFEIKTVRLDKH